MSAHPLDRPVWNMLNGPQASLAVARGAAVRLDPGYGPFAAARDDSAEAQAALTALLTDPADRIWIVETREWPAPPGTRVEKVAELVQLTAPEPASMRPGDETVELLGDDDVPAMAELALATRPGPWGALTQCYGAYYGIRHEGRLAAMAGERMRPAPGFAEVSGVCTWPEHRGQGHAARLIRRIMAGFTARGDTPFLHSYAANDGAIRLYQSLGFEIRSNLIATVLARA
ncbi:GNAT family N-acetyltransferase [Novosphingobium mangrovi (ex Huang et al. 2023)]|uniref:GNAT family N-acetyltransferase n=1 Tax=Novosphingobium mangrovi (ex Huang et al. 2023) TaxID=2976432 RepID=A0ABT2I7B2_9SPHN|nr:GNAT family N-acetyltransferase [Novosphingobium mangrovi (ex Huang et al. 2023)]MCT2400705.1 GNAT family N-acetyltransferase [Novosphingobium mangrovi (ex Huang et al. 2023)]